MSIQISASQSASQNDLFGGLSHITQLPNDELVTLVRARLRAALALVKSATAQPWTGQLTIIREDNAFRFGKDLLPPAEAAALWAEFNVEMDRLYAIMNAGKQPDLGE